MEDRTVKQLAEELGISKPYVMKRIELLGLKERLIKAGNKFIVPVFVADQVRESFKAPEPPVRGKEVDSSVDSSELVRILQEQLAIKDKQIERLQAENSELVKAIQQSNYLLTMTAQPADPAEQEDISAPAPEQPPVNEEPARPRSWFFRVFRR